jgi:hypothetical protein
MIKEMTELLLMREVLRNRLIEVVLGNTINLVLIFKPLFISKNKPLEKILNLIYASIIYTATKPLRKITETIKELDIAIENMLENIKVS